MGLRFRRSTKIAPGVRLNISKDSASVSVGPKGAKYTVSSTGKKTATVGVPGTGINYTETTGGGMSHREAMAKPAKQHQVLGVILFVISALSFVAAIGAQSTGGTVFGVLAGIVFALFGLKCLIRRKG